MNNILVLKTDVKNHLEVSKVNKVLSRIPKIRQITVDLDDIDKVLRVEGENLQLSKIVEKVSRLGFQCEELKN